MVRFVDIPQRDKPAISINPERVAYLRPRVGDTTTLVFEGFAGGVHALDVPLRKEQLEHLLTAYPDDDLPFLRTAAEAMAASPRLDLRVFTERVLVDVAELPDRTSPEDQPTMMMVDGNELAAIIQKHWADTATPDAGNALDGDGDSLTAAGKAAQKADAQKAAKASRGGAGRPATPVAD